MPSLCPARVTAPVSGGSREGPQNEEELLLAVTLTTQWMLITGRLLGHRPVLHGLGAASLIDFWADDHLDETVQGSKKGLKCVSTTGCS
ncbi:hypothetical protein [Actinocorallia populi]|uniref:hypothetical protein n=1 Tax=Actinocorallia populi TaxID=2079200 RepID=UPI000D092A1C|nr:hypothetical protein [Actinocorallia populi]